MGRRTEGDVMMKAGPGAAFKVVEAEFAFQFLIVAFDTPPQFAESHERA